MPPAGTAFQRARKQLKSRSGAGLVTALTIVEVVLTVKLLLTVGLILALLTSRGVTRLTPGDQTNPPSWMKAALTSQQRTGRHDIWVGDTGLTPLVVENQREGSPYPAWLTAMVVRRMVATFRSLQTNNSALIALLAIGLALLLALVLVGRWRRIGAVRIAAATATSLRRQIHRQLYRLGLSALPNEGVGPVVELFTRELTDLRDGLLADLDGSLRIPLLASLLLLVAFLISWPLSAFLFSLFCLCFLIARPLTRQTREEADAAARASALQLCLLHEDLGLVRLVRVFGMEAHDKDRFDAHLASHENAEVRLLQTEGPARPTLVLLLGVATVIGLGLLGFTVLNTGPWGLSLAAGLVLVAALLGVLRLVYRFEALRKALRQADRSTVALFNYLDRKPDLLMAAEAQFLPPLRHRITFENVSLRGGAGQTILEGVSVDILAGTRTAIVGLEESSKQAMTCLIPRLIDPTVGRVRIDGRDLRDITLESLRAQIATIFQADLVFSDSVFNNIGLGDPSYGLPKIIDAAKFAHAHNFIQDLPNGYETLIGPLGEFLRPDELYRIALARAFLHDPSIVIIEEPSTPLDDEVKPLIDDTVDRLAQKRTLIFIPHRLSSIRKCDQVLILHNGCLEETGQPRELERKSKLFRHIQYVEFNQFATGEIEAGQMEG